MRKQLAIILAFFVLAGCVSPQDPIPGTLEQPVLNATASAGSTPAENIAPPPETSTPETSPLPPVELLPLETQLAEPATSALVDQAKQMLADKLGINIGEIALFNLQARDWPNEALGCPFGEQNYAQVITPGYLIELEADGNIFAFHTDRSTRVLLCEIAPTPEIYQPP